MFASCVVLLAACEPAPPAVVLPWFATALPGHTVAVAWSEQGPLAVIELPAEVEAWCGVTRAPTDERVAAWTGDATAVAWDTLAANHLFAAASVAVPSGDRRWFVDLQQAVDLLVRAAKASDAAEGARDPLSAMRGVLLQRLVEAMHLRGLLWLVAGERGGGERTEVQALLAATDADAGLIGLLGSGAPNRRPASWPRAGAEMACIARFVPRVAVRIARDLVSSEGDGPLQMAREMLRGPRLESGLAALAALAGDAFACGSREFQWLWLSVADERALSDALDVLAAPSAGGWQLGAWRLEIGDRALVGTSGRLPAPTPLPPARAGLWLAVQAIAGELWVVRDAVPERLRLQAEFASKPR